MESFINLKDLFNHEVLELYSAEKQIIEALPAIIYNAHNAQLKNALEEHLQVTKIHKNRLEKIITQNKSERNEYKARYSRLFGGVSEPKCKAIETLIKEAKKIMDENMMPAVKDAAIISIAQKVQHYEISGYGTALAYAGQLNLDFAITHLQQVLDDEYKADKVLTKIAVGQLNANAESTATNYNTDEGYMENVSENSEGKFIFSDYARDVTYPVNDEDEFDDKKIHPEKLE